MPTYGKAKPGPGTVPPPRAPIEPPEPKSNSSSKHTVEVLGTISVMEFTPSWEMIANAL